MGKKFKTKGLGLLLPCQEQALLPQLVQPHAITILETDITEKQPDGTAQFVKDESKFYYNDF